MRRMRPSALVMACLLVGLLGSACAGPRVPLAVGVRDYPTNMILGAQKDILAAPPLPPVAAVVPPPALSAVPFTASSPSPTVSSPTSTTVPPSVPKPACPTDLLAVPQLVAPDTIALPPAPATYQYRVKGSYQTSGATPQQGAYPAESTRTVSNVKANPSALVSFAYDVTASLGDTTTTTTYAFRPPGEEATTPAGPTPNAGLFITKVVTTVGTNPAVTFNPNPPGLLLMEAPAVPGNTWHTAATDPVSQITMAFTGTEGAKARVDACGSAIDAVSVHVDGSLGPAGASGVNVAPTGESAETFEADYAIATQYGGLAVSDSVSISGVDGGVSSGRAIDSRINSVPAPPRQP